MRDRARFSPISERPLTALRRVGWRSSVPANVRRLAALGAVALLFALAAGGCSRQDEGERCDQTANGDADCEEGLICTAKVGADRCCPPPGAPVDDARCLAADAPSGGITGGTSGGGATSGGASSGGTSGGGATSGGASSGGTASGGASSGGTSGGDTASSGAGGVIEPTAGAGGDAANVGGESGAAAEMAGSGGQSESTAGTSGDP
jgi:hypothetical protein